MARDVVCDMEVDEKKAKYRSNYGGRTYYFCCERCKDIFEKDPTKFVT